MTVPRIAVIQNMAKVTAGTLAAGLTDAGALLDVFHPYDDGRLPARDGEYDALLILGGLTDALDDGTCPYFPALLDIIRDFHRDGRPVLGICLGAQLVARAFGATIRLAGPAEFGFTLLTRTAEGRDDPVIGGLGASAWIMQWHTDHYDLPAGAVRLWSGATYPNQAIRIGRATYAIQAHPEASREMIAAWLDADSEIHRAVPDLEDWLPGQMDHHADQQATLCRDLATRWAALARIDQPHLAPANTTPLDR